VNRIHTSVTVSNQTPFTQDMGAFYLRQELHALIG
jgi:hypothetical protein